MGDFLNMGGYAGYVWPAYAVSIVAIAALAFWIWRRARILRSRLEKLKPPGETGPTKVG